MPGVIGNPGKINVFRAPAGVDGAGTSPNTSACAGKGSNQEKYRAALAVRMERVARACLGNEADEILRGKSHEDILVLCARRKPEALMGELKEGNLRELFCLDAEQVVKVVKGFAASSQGVEIAMHSFSRLGLENDTQKTGIASAFARSNRDCVVRNFYALQMKDQKLIAQAVEGLGLDGHDLIKSWRKFGLSDFSAAKEQLSTCFRADPAATVKLIKDMGFENMLTLTVSRDALREVFSGAVSDSELVMAERIWGGVGMTLAASFVLSTAFAAPGQMSSLIQGVSLTCLTGALACVMRAGRMAEVLKIRGLFG